MEHESGKGLVTAYESNTRSVNRKLSPQSSEWHAKIRDLISQDYSFLPLTYSDTGVLYRGYSCGLLQAIKSDLFEKFNSDNPHSALEAELDVYFLSHELSDALTIARLWEQTEDACLLCLPGNLFNNRHQAKAAAVMAFSEPGFVFNYPFITEPIDIQNVMIIFINHATYASLIESLPEDIFATIRPLLHIMDKNISQAGRASVENYISNYFNNNHIQSATLVETEFYPTK